MTQLRSAEDAIKQAGRFTGKKHTPEWFARFRKPRPACLICGKEVRRQYNKMCSISCSNLYKYKDPSNHPSWRGGVTPAYRKLRASMWKELNDFSKAVIARDKKCVQCGATARLQADHIKPFILYPELRTDLSNGRTLCRPCHEATPTYGARIRKDKKYQETILSGGNIKEYWESLP